LANNSAPLLATPVRDLTDAKRATISSRLPAVSGGRILAARVRIASSGFSK